MSLLPHPAGHAPLVHHAWRALISAWNAVALTATRAGYPARAAVQFRDEIAPGLLRTRPLRGVGYVVHQNVCRLQPRRRASRYATFLQNRPLLAVLRRLAVEWPPGRSVRLAVVGCGTGAELYSVLWTMRGARRDLVVHAVGTDASSVALSSAAAGRYAIGDAELASIDERETEELFELEQDDRVVRPWIAAGVEWRVADVHDDEALRSLAGQDIVLANDVLRHLTDDDAERCLDRVARLVAPGGYVVTCDMSADVRRRVMRRLGYLPVPVEIRALHAARPDALAQWPMAYWAREPLDVRRPDWIHRYAVIHQRPAWDSPTAGGSVAQSGTAYTDA